MEEIEKKENYYEITLKKINEGDTAGAFKIIFQSPNISGRRRDEIKKRLTEKLQQQLSDGNEEARQMLYSCYCCGGQPEKAIELYMPLAERGDREAEYVIENI